MQYETHTMQCKPYKIKYEMYIHIGGCIQYCTNWR